MRSHLLAPVDLDEELLEPLVRRTLAGERRAWTELWCALDPMIERIAGRFPMAGRQSCREDERRNIVVRVMERLRADGFQRLCGFHEVLLRRDGSFRAWLRIVTIRTAVSYTRVHPEHLGAHDAEGEHRWVEMVPLSERGEDLLPVSIRAAKMVEAHRIQAYVEHDLPPQERDALRLWLSGHDGAEIAAALQLAGADVAEHLVRAVVRRLRRRFAADEGPKKKSTGPRHGSARKCVLYK